VHHGGVDVQRDLLAARRRGPGNLSVTVTRLPRNRAGKVRLLSASMRK
jgi:hypothetical protein